MAFAWIGVGISYPASRRERKSGSARPRSTKDELFKKISLSSRPETRLAPSSFTVTNRAPGGPDNVVAPDIRLSTPGYSQKAAQRSHDDVPERMGQLALDVKPAFEKPCAEQQIPMRNLLQILGKILRRERIFLVVRYCWQDGVETGRSDVCLFRRGTLDPHQSSTRP